MRKSNSLSTTTTSFGKNNNTSYNRKFIISSIILVILFCFIAFINDIRIEHVLSIHKRAFSGVTYYNPFQSSNIIICNNNNNNSSTTNTDTDDELRILIGVLALPDHYRPRDFLRRVYNVQPRPTGVKVDVKFIFCNITKPDQKILIPLEILTHDDIIILNCTENMDNGKTYTYFSSLPSIFSSDDNKTSSNPPYHYVMKTDYDTFIRVPNFAESLRPLPREDLYYGFAFPCRNTAMRGTYMAGMGYVLSWDIVEWISRSEIPRNHQRGPEDRLVGEWLKNGNKGNNSFNAKWKMHDYPHEGEPCSHPLWEETVAVHQLKTQERWMDVLTYFNITKDRLKPSKLYYI